MSNSARSKFAGFLRGLIGRADDRTSARPVASAAPAPTSAPAPLVSHAVTSNDTTRAAGADEIELPLAPVVAGLPLDLRAKLMAVPSASQMIRLQAEMVINQLAFGTVKITFGELRRLTPRIFSNSDGDLDNKLVSLPLQEILPRLNSALLARRSSKKVEVSDDIVGPFAERGRGFSFTTQPLKAQATPAPASLPAPAPLPVPPIAFAPPIAARPTSPLQVPPPVPQRSITPVAPTNETASNGHSQPLPVSPLSPRTVTPMTPAGIGTNGNGHGSSLPPGLRLGQSNGNSHAEVPTSAAPRPSPALPTIFATIGDLCETWPESLKSEILRSPQLAQTNVPLDGSIVLPGMKRGRVVMLWRQLRLLAQPSSAPSPNDNLELELPLKVIAPLFLAAQKNPVRPQTRGPISTEIPDLFFGFPQAAATAPAALPLPAAPVTPTVPFAPFDPVVPPLPKPSERTQDTNFYVWGENGEVPETDEAGLRRKEPPQTDFTSRQMHPKDAVARAMAMPGVAGSVVAMPDGLRVASHVPVELNADTVAAFLPQIFDRVNQSTRELRMGPLNNVNFTVGNVPWKIFRVNAVYFAAFGRAGEQLPSAQLAQLAAELDRKK